MNTESGKKKDLDFFEVSGREQDALLGSAGHAVMSPYGGDGRPSPRDPLQMAMAAILRYKWFVLAVTVVFSLITVASIWNFVVPLYRARAVVRVSPVGTKIVFRTEDNGMMPLYKSFLNTQVTIIRGPAVLGRVLDDTEVQATEWYKDTSSPWIGSPPTHLERLLQDLAVAPRANTELIDVAMTAQIASDAKLIADTVVRVYEAYTNEMSSDTDVVRLKTLLQEKGELEREIDGLVATKSHVTAQIGAADPVERLSQASARLATLEAEHDGVDRRLSLTKWKLARLPEIGGDPADATGRDASVSEMPDSSKEAGEDRRPVDYARDAEWRRLKENVTDARHNMERGQQRFGPLHPQIAELARLVTNAEELMQERVVQLDEKARSFPDAAQEANAGFQHGTGRDALSRQADLLTNDLALLDATIDKARAKVNELGQVTKDMSRYVEELRHKRETHGLLRTRVEQLTLERKAPARITVAAYSISPTSPSKDRRMLLTVMAILGSLGLGVGLSYLRLIMDPTVRDRVDVENPMMARFLGHLPQLNEWQPIHSSYPPTVLEVMRMVRTALLGRVDPSKANALLVTSSSPHAGKTSVSILLANSLASLGKRTLLVEADLRRPSIADRLSLDPRQGLAAVLTGDASEDDVICSSPTLTFDILPAGRTPEGFVPDILANGVMTSALKRWKQRYDFVILDSPPVSPVADARILGGLCDGTIMVIRASHCRRTEVAEAYNSLATTGANVLGTILIGGSRSADYYRDYDDSYEYGSEKQGPQLLEKGKRGNGV